MKYSIIIPAWNEAEFLPMTLSAVNASMQQLESQSAHRGELIVVDNNSTDNTAAIAEAQGAKVVFEACNQIARARNCGAHVATGEALVFIDADSQCTALLLNHVLDLLEDGSTVGGGSLIQPDKPITGTPLRALKLWNLIAIKAGFAAGCFVFCRKDAFEEVGGFNTRVYASEEIFLSRALKRWGRRHSHKFHIATLSPVVTSVRKLEWYTPVQIIRQALLVLIPGAVYSKTLCKTWYDSASSRVKS